MRETGVESWKVDKIVKRANVRTGEIIGEHRRTGRLRVPEANVGPDLFLCSVYFTGDKHSFGGNKLLCAERAERLQGSIQTLKLLLCGLGRERCLHDIPERRVRK